MATQSGVNGSVKIGTVLVADMAAWSVSDSTPSMKKPVFGQTSTKIHGMGIREVTGSISGLLNVDDSTGQEVIRAAYEAKTSISDFRLYVNDGDYWKGEAFIISMPVSVEAEGLVPVEFGFEINGDWDFTNA